jgi:phospholipid/cholesterol/gamma-HCH transport system substrate-binding protein
MADVDFLRSPDRQRNRVAAIAAVVVIALLVAVAVGTYQQVFSRAIQVTVHVPRAGLLLDKGAQVRAFGVKVGTVRAVEPAAHGARLTLAIDAERTDAIPRDASATIAATSVFGNKTVDLDVPNGPVADPLRDGDVLTGDQVSTEVNDVFAQLKGVLDVVDPAALNTALSATATALSGRGDDLGTLVSGVADYTATLNKHQEAIASDIKDGADVADIYAQAAPDLVRVLKQAGRTSESISDKDDELRDLLSSLTELGDTGDTLLRTVKDPLSLSLRRLRPVTASLATFSPEFQCLLAGMVTHRDGINAHLGADVAGFQGNVSFLPAQHGYTTERDRPKLIPNAVPHCFTVPALNEKNPPHHNWSDGSHAYDVAGPTGPPTDPVTLYRDAVADWFGQSGMAALLGAGPESSSGSSKGSSSGSSKGSDKSSSSSVPGGGQR